MKPTTHLCIQRWRKSNPDKARAQGRKSSAKHYEWVKISREFLRIMLWEDIKEKRGRPRKFPNCLGN